nr:LuxR C-terminal-related transcriptional regulator [Streptomyces sp. WM6373]
MRCGTWCARPPDGRPRRSGSTCRRVSCPDGVPGTRSPARRQISDLLHLARRTVETHLTSTYRKLGIQRRADLSAAMGTGGAGRRPVTEAGAAS